MNDRGERGKTGATPPGPSSRRPGPSDRHTESSVPSSGRSSRSSGTFAETGELARALFTYAPRRTVLALLLLLTAGVTEAFGLLMIIPLLHVAGFAAPAGQQSSIVETMERATDATGVEWTLPTVLAVFLILSSVRVAVAWRREVLLVEMRLGFIDRIRKNLYAALARTKWEFLHRRRQSDMQHLLTREVNRIGQGAFLILQLTVTAVLALVQLALAALISPSVTAVTLVAGAGLLALTRLLVQRSRALGEELTAANRAFYGSTTDFLGGLKLVKGYNTEERHVGHLTETVATMRKHELAFTRIHSAAQAGLQMGAAAILATLVWFALSTVPLSLPELLLMALIITRVLPALFRLQRNAQQLAHTLPAYAHAQAMQRELEEAAETPADGGKPRMELRNALTVRGVSFVYEAGAGRRMVTGSGFDSGSGTRADADVRAGAATEPGDGAKTAEPALEDVTLDVPAGKMTVITGPSGAGKSTLADLLIGLLEPGRGEVCVDGVLLTGPNPRRWRHSVSFVPQDPWLFHDTIRANLQWVRPEATEAEMWQALRLAAADGFVAALPEGLDTVTGDRGGWLSGGERQRISLARALMRRPELLVVDEATSQLDAESERQALATLKSLRGRTTVVAIAHRPAVLEAADGIVLLKSGRVAATGTWRELAAEITAAGTAGSAAGERTCG